MSPQSNGRKGTCYQVLPSISILVGGAGICMIIVLIFAGIVARTAFNYSMPIAIEYSEYLIPIIAFWGAPYALRVGGHVNADVFVCLLPGKIRQIFLFIAYFVALGYLVPLSWQCFNLWWHSFRGQETSMYPSGTPIGYPQLIMFMGVGLFTLQLIVEIFIKAKLLMSGGPGNPEIEPIANK